MTDTRATLSARPSCRLVDWHPFPNAGALVGKATIEFPGGWIVAGIPVFRRQDGSLSSGGPDAPILDKEGRHATDQGGKKRYAKIITFKDKAAQQRWERLVIDCVTGAIE